MIDVSYQMAHKAVFHVTLTSSTSQMNLMSMLQGIVYDYVRHEYSCVLEWPRFCGFYQMESADKRIALQTAYCRDKPNGDKTDWAVRIKNRDYAVKRRNWLTHIGIHIESPSEAIVYYAQLYHDHLAGSFSAPKPIDSEPPHFYKKLMSIKRLECRTGMFPITSIAIPISMEIVNDFVNLARDPNRHIPLLLISCPDLMDPDVAARKFVGNLVVCWLDDMKLMNAINEKLAPDMYIEWDSVQVILPFTEKPQDQFHPSFMASDMTRLGSTHAFNMLYRAFCTALRADDRREFVSTDGLFREKDRKAYAQLQELYQALMTEKNVLTESNERLMVSLSTLQREHNKLADDKLKQENSALEQLLNEAQAKREKLQNGISDLTQRLYASMGKDFTPIDTGEAALCELEHAIYVCFARLLNGK